MIEGVEVIDLTTREDDRGYLIEIARRADDPEPHGVVHQFGQVYFVGDPVRGSIRAFHKHNELWDWFFISHGSAKFVLKDDREDSPTHGEMMTIISSLRNPRLIVIPPGVFHGWMSLEDYRPASEKPHRPAVPKKGAAPPSPWSVHSSGRQNGRSSWTWT